MSEAHDEMFACICSRLQANVARKQPDTAGDVLSVPAHQYSDAAQFEREIQTFYMRSPLLVALACDVPEPGDYFAYTLVGQPLLIVRGDDGVIRTFLNICRHRGAKVAAEGCGNVRSFICPYHSWSYTREGKLAGVPDADSFGETGVTGLLALPCEERAGAVFSILAAQATLDLDAWLGADFLASLSALRLNELYPYRKLSELDSPNWKLAADGYLDGYHIGYLHKNTIGKKSITNRNTYDMWGPHARIGFATRKIDEFETVAPECRYWPDHMSLVHYIFPNVSLSGGHGDTLQLSRLFPGPQVHESTTMQHQYFRAPIVGDMIAIAEDKRQIYEQVVRDEDCATIFGISEALPAMSDSPILFGRNEPANQNMHQYIERVLAGQNEDRSKT